MSYEYIIGLAVVGYAFDRVASYRLARSTHTIVNNERSVMLRTISNLSARVAKDNPLDEQAQRAAFIAQQDVERTT